jgi:hypothetical protein
MATEDWNMLGARQGAQAGGGGDIRYLTRSVIFLVVLAVLGYLTRTELVDGIQANPMLNGTILATLAFGILYTFGALIDVFRVSRAAAHATSLVAEVQAGNQQLEHVNEILLGPSRSGVGDFLRTVHRVLSQGETSATLPYMLDSVAAHAEDRRALVRYLTGALVLLGLIGTFYGLLVTIGGVRDVLGSLTADANADTMELLVGLKERLATPLGGMSVAFSSSLFGLLASLVLAFLELQLFHAQNNLHARLENLVVSDLMPLWHRPAAGAGAAATATTPGYVTALLSSAGERLESVAGALESLTRDGLGVNRLNEQLGSLNERVESLRETLQTLEQDRTTSLRQELRMLARLLSKED